MGGRPCKTLLKSLLGLPTRLQNQYNVKNPACQYKCAVLAQIFLTAREMAQASPKSQVQDTVISSWLWTFDFGRRCWKLSRLTSIGKPFVQSSSTIKAWSDAPLGRTYNQTPGHCEGKPPFSRRVLASPWVDRSPDLITMARSS